MEALGFQEGSTVLPGPANQSGQVVKDSLGNDTTEFWEQIRKWQREDDLERLKQEVYELQEARRQEGFDRINNIR